MEFLITLFFFYILFQIIKNAGKKNNVDWGNVGAKIENAQKVMKDISENEITYGRNKLPNNLDKYQSHKDNKSLEEILSKVQERNKSHTSSWEKQDTAWRENKPSQKKSHQRTHIHSGSDYSNKNYVNKNVKDADAALRKCKRAVDKGFFDKRDRGKTVDRG